MSPETARPAAGDSRPGLDDFRGQRKIEVSLNRNPNLRQAEASLRRQHLARQLHRLGARVVFELLDEIARHYELADDIDARLARYAGADPAILAAVGGDKFAPLPLRSIGGVR
jgi:hypothetical protein